MTNKEILLGGVSAVLVFVLYATKKHTASVPAPAATQPAVAGNSPTAGNSLTPGFDVTMQGIFGGSNIFINPAQQAQVNSPFAAGMMPMFGFVGFAS